MIIQCLSCLSPITISESIAKKISTLDDFAIQDILDQTKGFNCSKCGSKSTEFRIFDGENNCVGDSRIVPKCQRCKKTVTLDELNRQIQLKIISSKPNSCSRCSKVSRDKVELTEESPEIITFLNWKLPFKESFFATWLLNSLVKEHEAAYQLSHRKHALKFVKNFDVALDIGGHWGLWTKPLLSRFKEVYAFEPNPNSLPILNANAPNATIYPFGLSNTTSTQHLNINVRQSGGAFIDMSDNEHTIPIQVRTLDSFNFQKIDFIKMDCEGFEYEVVLGGIETIKRTKPIINLEQKPNHTESRGLDKLAATHFLVNELDYEILGRHVDEWVLGPKK